MSYPPRFPPLLVYVRRRSVVATGAVNAADAHRVALAAGLVLRAALGAHLVVTIRWVLADVVVVSHD